MRRIDLRLGDCLEVLKTMPPDSVDSIVCDPPYELGFMGKSWDRSGIAFNAEVWRLCLRVLKPGGHLMAFGGTRTYHRIACAIEDAGFTIRDTLAWVYGSGFPKSLDVSKAIDKASGAKREVVGVAGKSGSERNAMANDFKGGEYFSTTPTTPTAKEWSGWGTALKPAYEPIILARKPLSEKTVAANVMKWGTGALNIDASRIEGVDQDKFAKNWQRETISDMRGGNLMNSKAAGMPNYKTAPTGRFPANFLMSCLCTDTHDLECPVHILDGQSGIRRSSGVFENKGMGTGNGNTYLPVKPTGPMYSDTGFASRFFYVAKASKRERGIGNGHPTVKPLKLMRYLVRLITPPNGTVLDPFMGSGSTGCAAIEEGFQFTGIEREPEYFGIASRRIEHATFVASLPTDTNCVYGGTDGAPAN